MTAENARSRTSDLKIGEFRVQPSLHRISGPDGEVQVEPRVMAVFEILAERAPDVVTRQELLDQAWAEKFISDDVLTNAIFELRRALGDNAQKPRFVETVRGRGYRLIVPAVPATEKPPGDKPVGKARSRLRAAGLLLGLLTLVTVLYGGKSVRAPSRHNRANTEFAAGIEINSLAVLPFHDLTGDPEDSYLADAFVDALITEVGMTLPLRVISRTSTQRFDRSELPLATIAEELGVDALVEGSVSQWNDQWEISAKLMRTEPERQLWAGRYTCDRGDIPKTVTQVAESIASLIGASRAPTASPLGRDVDGEVVELYLRGRHTLHRREEGWKRAAAYFERAVEIDPDFAPAWAGLADSLSLSNPKISASLHERVRDAAETALELDGNLPEAHLAMARVFGAVDWDFAAAEASLMRAIELNPNMSRAHDRYARYLSLMGRHDAARTANRKARELDPLSQEVNTNAARIAFFAGRCDEATVYASRVLELNIAARPARLLLGVCAVQLGEYDAGLEELRKLESRATMAGEIGHSLAVAGDRARASEVAQSLEQMDPVPTYQLALVYAGLGERDQAAAWIERSIANRDPQSIRAYSDPRLRDILELAELENPFQQPIVNDGLPELPSR